MPRLPPDEYERVLTALAVYANVEEYRKDNPEKARSIRSTARGIETVTLDRGGP